MTWKFFSFIRNRFKYCLNFPFFLGSAFFFYSLLRNGLSNWNILGTRYRLHTKTFWVQYQENLLSWSFCILLSHYIFYASKRLFCVPTNVLITCVSTVMKIKHGNYAALNFWFFSAQDSCDRRNVSYVNKYYDSSIKFIFYSFWGNTLSLSYSSPSFLLILNAIWSYVLGVSIFF